ncbi:MAG: BRCT domain-containing protein, partial [Planctomycetota bacterium]
ITDRFNPITEGDKVASPFYNQDDVPLFVIAGDKLANRRLSMEEMVRKVEAFGGKVEDNVHIKTSYLIAVVGYENTKQYDDARQLGITILREDELFDFISD